MGKPKYLLSPKEWGNLIACARDLLLSTNLREENGFLVFFLRFLVMVGFACQVFFGAVLGRYWQRDERVREIGEERRGEMGELYWHLACGGLTLIFFIPLFFIPPSVSEEENQPQERVAPLTRQNSTRSMRDRSQRQVEKREERRMKERRAEEGQRGEESRREGRMEENKSLIRRVFSTPDKGTLLLYCVVSFVLTALSSFLLCMMLPSRTDEFYFWDRLRTSLFALDWLFAISFAVSVGMFYGGLFTSPTVQRLPCPEIDETHKIGKEKIEILTRIFYIMALHITAIVFASKNHFSTSLSLSLVILFFPFIEVLALLPSLKVLIHVAFELLERMLGGLLGGSVRVTEAAITSSISLLAVTISSICVAIFDAPMFAVCLIALILGTLRTLAPIDTGIFSSKFPARLKPEGKSDAERIEEETRHESKSKRNARPAEESRDDFSFGNWMRRFWGECLMFRGEIIMFWIVAAVFALCYFLIDAEFFYNDSRELSANMRAVSITVRSLFIGFATLFALLSLFCTMHQNLTFTIFQTRFTIPCYWDHQNFHRPKKIICSSRLAGREGNDLIYSFANPANNRVTSEQIANDNSHPFQVETAVSRVTSQRSARTAVSKRFYVFSRPFAFTLGTLRTLASMACGFLMILILCFTSSPVSFQPSDSGWGMFAISIWTLYASRQFFIRPESYAISCLIIHILDATGALSFMPSPPSLLSSLPLRTLLLELFISRTLHFLLTVHKAYYFIFSNGFLGIESQLLSVSSLSLLSLILLPLNIALIAIHCYTGLFSLSFVLSSPLLTLNAINSTSLPSPPLPSRSSIISSSFPPSSLFSSPLLSSPLVLYSSGKSGVEWKLVTVSILELLRTSQRTGLWNPNEQCDRTLMLYVANSSKILLVSVLSAGRDWVAIQIRAKDFDAFPSADVRCELRAIETKLHQKFGDIETMDAVSFRRLVSASWRRHERFNSGGRRALDEETGDGEVELETGEPETPIIVSPLYGDADGCEFRDTSKIDISSICRDENVMRKFYENLTQCIFYVLLRTSNFEAWYNYFTASLQHVRESFANGSHLADIAKADLHEEVFFDFIYSSQIVRDFIFREWSHDTHQKFMETPYHLTVSNSYVRDPVKSIKFLFEDFSHPNSIWHHFFPQQDLNSSFTESVLSTAFHATFEKKVDKQTGESEFVHVEEEKKDEEETGEIKVDKNHWTNFRQYDFSPNASADFSILYPVGEKKENLMASANSGANDAKNFQGANDANNIQDADSLDELYVSENSGPQETGGMDQSTVSANVFANNANLAASFVAFANTEAPEIKNVNIEESETRNALPEKKQINFASNLRAGEKKEMDPETASRNANLLRQEFIYFLTMSIAISIVGDGTRFSPWETDLMKYWRGDFLMGGEQHANDKFTFLRWVRHEPFLRTVAKLATRLALVLTVEDREDENGEKLGSEGERSARNRRGEERRGEEEKEEKRGEQFLSRVGEIFDGCYMGYFDDERDFDINEKIVWETAWESHKGKIVRFYERRDGKRFYEINHQKKKRSIKIMSVNEFLMNSQLITSHLERDVIHVSSPFSLPSSKDTSTCRQIFKQLFFSPHFVSQPIVLSPFLPVLDMPDYD